MKLRITDTQIDYEGSITIGRKLLNGLLDGEKVTIHCLNGEQFETYVIAGDKELREKVARVICCFAKGSTSCSKCEYNTPDDPFPDCFWDIREETDKILDLCEEGICVNGAAARLVQVGDWIEVNNEL